MKASKINIKRIECRILLKRFGCKKNVNAQIASCMKTNNCAREEAIKVLIYSYTYELIGFPKSSILLDGEDVQQYHPYGVGP